MPACRTFGRVRLRWVSMAQIVALLFMQFAIAAYRCPAVAADAAVAVADCVAHSKSPADPTLSQLCKVHCLSDDQAVGATQTVGASAAPLLLAVLDWQAALLAVPAPVDPDFDRLSGAPPPGTPPRYLSLRILRR